jgi:hypothetical protein
MGYVNGRDGDPDVERVVGALKPLRGEIYTQRLRVTGPSASQLLAERAVKAMGSNATTPAAAVIRPNHPSWGQRVVRWLRSWMR